MLPFLHEQERESAGRAARPGGLRRRRIQCECVRRALAKNDENRRSKWIPACAGMTKLKAVDGAVPETWIPACAGMTSRGVGRVKVTPGA